MRPLGVARLVRGQREVCSVRVYRGMPSSERDPKGFGACQRQVAQWESNSITVVTRPLNYREASRPREKGIDVHLAIDLVMGAMRNEYDVAVLFSADTDLLPAVEAVLQIKGAGSVEFAAWLPDDGRPANRLRAPDPSGVPVWCHLLRRIDYERAVDVTDYTRKPRRDRRPPPSGS